MDLDEELLALASPTKPTPKQPAKRKPKRKLNLSDSDHDDTDGDFDVDSDSDAQDSDDEMFAEAKTWGEDLMGDHEDRRRLERMTEVERETILAERSEKRQMMLERMEVKRKLREAQQASTSTKLQRLADTRKSARRTSEKKTKSFSTLKDRRERRLRKQGDDAHSITYSSESDESGEMDEQQDHVITRHEALQIQVTRIQVEKWCHASFFEETIKGSLVRIGLGNDPKTRERVYRVAQVAAVVDYHKVYDVGGVPVKMALSLMHGKAKRTFTMDILSNSPFTENEWSRYQAAMKADKMTLFKMSFLNKKLEHINKAKDYIFTDEEIRDMVNQKKALRKVPVNFAIERTRLTRERDIAQQKGDLDEVEELEKQLNNLEEMAKAVKNKTANSKLDLLAKVNERNRRLNMMDTKEAEKAALEMRLKRRQERPSESSRRTSEISNLISPINDEAASLLHQKVHEILDQEALEQFDDEAFWQTVDISAIEALV